MSTGQQKAVDQRLDQHSDAMEIILDRLDSIGRSCCIMLRQAERIKGRIRELESIVLPDPKPGGPARPTLPRDQHAQGAPDLDKPWPARPSLPST